MSPCKGRLARVFTREYKPPFPNRKQLSPVLLIKSVPRVRVKLAEPCVQAPWSEWRYIHTQLFSPFPDMVKRPHVNALPLMGHGSQSADTT